VAGTSALSVSSRLWLGGVVQVQRDRHLVRTLLLGVRACGAFQSLLLCTDGLSSYPKQALKVFSEPIRSGKRGRPRLLLPEGVMVAQAVKRYARRRVVGVLRRVVRGTEAEVEERLRATQGATTAVINTAYIERLHKPPFAPGWLLCGAQDAGGGASEGDAGGGDVVGRYGLQLLPSASFSEAGMQQGRPEAATMDRENPSSSCWAH
jgi:hypothetical protein